MVLRDVSGMRMSGCGHTKTQGQVSKGRTTASSAGRGKLCLYKWATLPSDEEEVGLVLLLQTAQRNERMRSSQRRLCSFA
jgi:hypothetical protein